METPNRRATDRRRAGDRRRSPDRREHELRADGARFPSWQEQVVQFLTRYLFFALGLVFFNFSSDFTPSWMSLTQINLVYAAYFIINTSIFLHARQQPYSPRRFRLAMWVDIVMVSVSMLNDPYDIPPSLLVFIMVVLGNGMRYGMRLFAEALVSCFAAAMVILSLRFTGADHSLTPGVIFLNVFGGIILVYAYILMARIEASRRHLERSSQFDSLTGLMNRRALFDAAEDMFKRMSRHKQCLVVMFADLDKFKYINDTHGHAVGDRTLQQVAEIIRGCVRSSDVAARHGGDEFVLILEDTDLDRAETVARRIQERVTEWARAHEFECSVTIGIGEAPRHGTSLTELLERVDRALYQSKASLGCGGIQRVDGTLRAGEEPAS